MAWTVEDDLVGQILADTARRRRQSPGEAVLADNPVLGHQGLPERPEWLRGASRFISDNPGRELLAGGLGNVAEKMYQGQDPSYADYVMAGLDIPGPETLAKAGALGAAGVIRGLKGFDPLQVVREWDLIGKAPKSAQTTQIAQTAKADPTRPAGTGGTYAKMGQLLEPGRTLDYGAGKGQGTQFLGTEAQRYEPFPEGWTPDYGDLTELPEGKFRNVVNSATLKVTPPTTSQLQAIGMARAVEPRGHVLSSARSKAAVEAAKTAQLVPGLPGGFNIPGKGYQEGYTPEKMQALFESVGLEPMKTRKFGEEAVIARAPMLDEEIEGLVREAGRLGAGKSTTLKAGKRVGDDLYAHRDYAMHVAPMEQLVPAARAAEEAGFTWNAVKHNRKTGDTTLQYSPDFDTAAEPKVGAYMTFDRDGNLKKAQTYSEGKEPIWHHKWQWVAPDYQGFDFPGAVQRSVDWQSRMQGVPRSGFGSQKNWAEALMEAGL